MQSGKLKTKIIIETETVTRNNFGEEIKSYTQKANVFARIRNLTGSEKFKELQELSVSATEFYIRFLPNISVKDRVVLTETFRGVQTTTYYKIESTANIDGANKELKILCTRIEA